MSTCGNDAPDSGEQKDSCPLTLLFESAFHSFLERHKTMRQIIGLLMELEKEEDKDDDVKATPNSEKEIVAVNEQSNNDDDSASVYSENEAGSFCGYDANSSPHYEAFRYKEPDVTWRDLAEGAATGAEDGKGLNKTHFGLKKDSSDSENEMSARRNMMMLWKTGNLMLSPRFRSWLS
jgi:hypothetical protein